MKTNRLINSIIIVSIILISGCEMEDPINIIQGNHIETISIYGFVSNKNGFEIELVKSLPPSSGDESQEVPYINNASIKAIKNGLVLGELEFKGNGKYLLTIEPQISTEDKYSIEVNIPEEESIHSETQRIPPKVYLDTIIIRPESQELYYYINDLQDSLDYYYFEYATFIDDSMVKPYSYSEYFNPYAVKKDVDIIHLGSNNVPIKLSYRIPLTGERKMVDSISCKLYHVSREYYSFCRSIVDYESSKDDPYYEYQSSIITNIIGGVGFFGSFSETEYSLSNLMYGF